MKLSDWLETNRMSASEFAEIIGVHRSTVGRWADPKYTGRPWRDLMAKIAKATNGQVTANDFMDDPAGDGDPGSDPGEPDGGGPTGNDTRDGRALGAAAA
jgi:transcriptional regulator with XRE-family HTH domain